MARARAAAATSSIRISHLIALQYEAWASAVPAEEITTGVSRFPAESHLGGQEGFPMPVLATRSDPAPAWSCWRLVGPAGRRSAPRVRPPRSTSSACWSAPGQGHRHTGHGLAVFGTNRQPVARQPDAAGRQGAARAAGTGCRHDPAPPADSLRNGAAWGLGIGAAAGMAACGTCHVGPGTDDGRPLRRHRRRNRRRHRRADRGKLVVYQRRTRPGASPSRRNSPSRTRASTCRCSLVRASWTIFPPLIVTRTFSRL